MKKTLSLIAAGLGLCLALTSNAYAYGIGDFFAPVPGSLRQAMSGFSLSAGSLTQDYTEHASTSNSPDPLDTQKGSVPEYTFGMAYMGGYLGIGAKWSFASGNTTYDGYLQNLSTGAMTPYTSQTSARFADMQIRLRAGFSPMSKLAILPEVFYGIHGWDRNNSANTGGYDETYGNSYSGVGVTVALLPVKQVAVLLSYQGGKTANAKMDSSISSDTANLGAEPWHRYGVEVDYTPWTHLTLFAALDQTEFKYGKSQTITMWGSYSGYEPNSTTKQTSTRLGFRVRF